MFYVYHSMIKRKAGENMKNIKTKDMLSMHHIDRGINISMEMKLMFTNLKHAPQEFNSEMAERMERLCQIINNCFYDCYNNCGAKNMSYDEIIQTLNKLEFKTKNKNQKAN